MLCTVLKKDEMDLCVLETLCSVLREDVVLYAYEGNCVRCLERMAYFMFLKGVCAMLRKDGMYQANEVCCAVCFSLFLIGMLIVLVV